MAHRASWTHAPHTHSLQHGGWAPSSGLWSVSGQSRPHRVPGKVALHPPGAHLLLLKVPHPPGTDLGKELPAPCARGHVGDHGVGVQLLPPLCRGVPFRRRLSLSQAPRWPLSPFGGRCLWQARQYLWGLCRDPQKVPSHRTSVATCDVASVWLAGSYETSSEPRAAWPGSSSGRTGQEGAAPLRRNPAPASPRRNLGLTCT